MKKFSFIFLAVLTALTACGGNTSPSSSTDTSSPVTSTSETTSSSSEESSTTSQYVPSGYFTLEPTEEIVSIYTEPQENYLRGSYAMISQYADGKQDISAPKGVKLEWDYSDENFKGKFEVHLATDESFTDEVVYTTSEKSYTVTNLMLGKTYFWEIECEGFPEEFSDTQYFTVDQSCGLRNVFVDGVTNFRDIGGYQFGDNEIIQGNIYRCAELNYAGSTAARIRKKGIKTLEEDFKIKSEIDFRENATIWESLIPGCDFYNFPMDYTGVSNIMDGSSEMIKNTFKVFGDEDKYPIIFHCRIGTDRTGMIAFLLLGLLGANRDQILKDYLFSNFGYIESNRTPGVIEEYYSYMNKFHGANTQEKIYTYLRSIGVTAEELDTILRMNLKKPVKLLENKQALFVDGDSMLADNSVEKDTINNISYYRVSNCPDKGIEVTYNTTKDTEVDVYAYMDGLDISVQLSHSLKFYINDAQQTLSIQTYKQLRCQQASTRFVPIKLGTYTQTAGDYKLRLNNMKDSINPYASGAEIAAFVIVPHSETLLTIKTVA